MENTDIALPREAETIWAFFIFSVGEKKLQLWHAAFLYIHKKIP